MGAKATPVGGKCVTRTSRRLTETGMRRSDETDARKVDARNVLAVSARNGRPTGSLQAVDASLGDVLGQALRLKSLLEPRDKREPVSRVRTEPLDMSADRTLGLARTPNGLDARSFFAWSNCEVQNVA